MTRPKPVYGYQDSAEASTFGGGYILGEYIFLSSTQQMVGAEINKNVTDIHLSRAGGGEQGGNK